MNVIHSIGPPPDRYANRVVAAMLRDLVKQRAAYTDVLMRTIYTSKDNNPEAQRKLAKKIENLIGMPVVLEPGKRGKYKICFFDMTGWDIRREKEIFTGDLMFDDDNFCLVVNANKVISLGNGHNHKTVNGGRFMFISKHVLVRLVQRFGVRTPAELIVGAEGIMHASIDFAAHIGINEFMTREHRIEMTQGAVLVLKPDVKWDLMVATTIFRKGETT